jgi:hypothetical protein
MLVSRRKICQKLLLVPAAAILSGCPDDATLAQWLVVVINNDKKNGYYICNDGSPAFGVSVPPGGQADGHIATPSENTPTVKFTVAILNQKSGMIVGKKNYSVNFILGATSELHLNRTHLYVQLDTSGSQLLPPTMVAQSGGG